MLILSFIFLTLALYGLVKGKMFYGFTIRMAKEEIKRNQTNNYKMSDDFAAAVLLFIMFSISYMITYILYLNAAIDIDTLKYPTLFMIAYCIYSFIKGLVVGKKNKYETEEDLINFKKTYKKYTVSGIVGNSISVAYHCYIIYLLVFV